VGIAGRGRVHCKNKELQGENMVALCDVDSGERVAEAIESFPKAMRYKDYRVMLDKEKDLDAVIVSTPDHTHYVVAMEAMKRGKHVYCEKPLAHSLYEVRKLTEAARKYKVQTQMGNQGHSDEYIRLLHEWVDDGAIGEVTKVEAWSDRPMGGYPFPGALPAPKDGPAVPDTLDWDLWLGPAQERSYHPLYAPIFWRGWLDFGTGALGDMGCHILDPSFWALDLVAPESVEANVSYNPDPGFWNDCFANGIMPHTRINEYIEMLRGHMYPSASIVRYKFPARGEKPAVELTWYDGGLLPPTPEELDMGRTLGTNGAILSGETGKIMHGSHGARGARIIPEAQMKAYELPAKTIKRVKSHHGDWINACKGGDAASSSFDYGGALTEMVLLGTIAMQVPNKKLLWDSEKLRFANSDEANALVKPTYREGWSL
jgi:predicted dehydrogenase